MNSRERTLAIAIGTLGLLWLVYMGWGRYRTALQDRETRLAEAQSDLQGAKIEQREGEQRTTQLQTWQKQSLPNDLTKAASLYEEWLRRTLTTAGLQVQMYSPTKVAQNSRDLYQTLGYSVTATGSLRQLASFQYAFERSAMLHKITRLTVRPLADRGNNNLEVTINVEAIAIPGAVATDALPDGVSENLAYGGNAGTFIDWVTSRNIFQRYTPQGQQRERNVASELVLSFIQWQPDGYVGTIRSQNSGEWTKVKAGDSFAFGSYRGQVESLSMSPREIVISTPPGSEQHLRVRMGDTFDRGRPFRPPQPQPRPGEEQNSQAADAAAAPVGDDEGASESRRGRGGRGGRRGRRGGGGQPAGDGASESPQPAAPQTSAGSDEPAEGSE